MYENNYLPNIKDTQEALKQYLKSANQDYEFAQVNLAMHYQNIATNDAFAKAFYWYKKAASNNNIVAIVNLANMYYFGQGTKKNYKKAVELYKIASNKNNMLAIVRATNDSKLLLIADSFSTANSMPYNVTFATLWKLHQSRLYGKRLASFVEKNHPNIVIYQIVERDLYTQKII
jgi:TPR repeat protein